jgi:hypothetical protein
VKGNRKYVVGSRLALRGEVEALGVVGDVQEVLYLLDGRLCLFDRLEGLEGDADGLELRTVLQIASCEFDVPRAFVSLVVNGKPPY